MISAAFAMSLSNTPHQDSGIRRKPWRIPVVATSGKTVLLQAEVYRPSGNDPFPLATINHGVPRDESIENLRRTKLRFSQAAEWFARRGFAVAVALRQGFGDSEGEFSEHSGPCEDRDYLAEGRATAADMLGIVAYMQNQPFVDATRIVIVGQSGGGLGALTIATNPPAGVLGIVSFAGARGSKEPGMVCCEEKLVAAMGILGAQNRLPGVWLFSENDQYFGSALANQLYEAYASASTPKVGFVRLPSFGNDGHRILYAATPDVWSSPVAAFLEKLAL